MLASTAFVFGEDSRLIRERTIHISLEERKKREIPKTLSQKIYYFFLSNITITCLTLYCLWTGIGILFYIYYDGWTPGTAYYYAMEAGLSIGFCNPVEIDDWSKLFTIVYVLTGSIIVSGTIGLFASSFIFAPKIRINRTKRRGSSISSVPSPNNRQRNPVFYQDLRSLQAAPPQSPARTPASPGGQSSSLSTEERTPKSLLRRSFLRIRYSWHYFLYFIGWDRYQARIISTVLFVVWMLLGTIYAFYIENWDWITSLYWAITTASSGGLQSAPCLGDTDATNCDIGNFRGSMMGVFMWVGVPIYAFAFGQYARMIISQTIRYREEKLLDRPIEDAEFLFAANILSPEGSETLVLGEYILLELMRLGITNKQQIEFMKRKFVELDVYNRGEVDIDDLRRTGKVIPAQQQVFLDI